MKTISVVGLKGGSGKTSTAVPLACEAARSGRTVVMDTDPTPSATEWIDAAGLGSDELVGARVDARDLERTLEEIRASGAVSWVVIDTPAGHRDVCMQAAGVADVVVIPVHVGSGDLAQLVQTLDLLRLPRRANPNLQVMAVLNHAGTMPALTRETREAVEGLGIQVARTEIPARRMYATAKGSKPKGWWHFTDLWKEIQELL